MSSILRRLVDYHVHSFHSIDGHSSIDEMCSQAVRLGLAEIGFCDHVDFTPNGLGLIDYERYSEELDKARSQYGGELTIRKGIEVDYNRTYHAQIEEWLDEKHFDFLLGSVHYVDDFIFDLGRKPGMSAETMIRKYYTRVRDAVESKLFNIVGHFDIIRGYIPTDQDPISLASDIIDSTFENMIANGVYLEINSWRRTDREPFPCKDLIQRYLKKEGKLFSLGSDAHSWQQLAVGIIQVRDLLLNLKPRNMRMLFEQVPNLP